MKMRTFKKIITLAACTAMLAGTGITASAETAAGFEQTKAQAFDPVFYMNTYPDVALSCGNNDYALLMHYLNAGMAEGRVPYEGAAPGTPVENPADKIEAAVKSGKIVPFEKLAHYSSLKRKQTDAQFREAYNEALTVVGPLADLSVEDQLVGIAQNLRYRFEKMGNYSTEQAHYDDPYGYLILNTASCAGCARATGLCLDMLGIPYEHVNESKWTHQWCRVPVGDTYWICDAFMAYAGPEPAPYVHPDGYSKEGVPVPESVKQAAAQNAQPTTNVIEINDLQTFLQIMAATGGMQGQTGNLTWGFDEPENNLQNHIANLAAANSDVLFIKESDGSTISIQGIAAEIVAEFEKNGGRNMTVSQFETALDAYMAKNLRHCASGGFQVYRRK